MWVWVHCARDDASLFSLSLSLTHSDWALVTVGEERTEKLFSALLGAMILPVCGFFPYHTYAQLITPW